MVEFLHPRPPSKWLLVCVCAALPGCSRSELLAAEPCDIEGSTRTCSNACADDGTQVCTDHFWQQCVVPDKYFSCSNQCGKGTALCSDGRLNECQVTDTRLPCSNTCGQGTALCSKGKPGTCEVPNAPVRTCTTGCGPGQQKCESGAWGKCAYAGGPRGCSNACTRYDGEGTQYCTGDSWSTCSVPRRVDSCLSACGSGNEVCENGAWTACDAPKPLPPRLTAIVRDFTPQTNSDFERPDISTSIDDRNAVLPDLGSDGLPVYAAAGATRTISGPESFNQFYRDTPGVNLTTTKYLQLVASPAVPGLFVYQNNSFFPIDGELFGNYSYFGHNYHFTLMVATEFVYVGGEKFTFSGDDDMWVFINRRLAIDLGGVHESETASIDLDADSPYLRINPGNRYALHLFFAERRTIDSNFTIRTSIADVGSCP